MSPSSLRQPGRIAVQDVLVYAVLREGVGVAKSAGEEPCHRRPDGYNGQVALGRIETAEVGCVAGQVVQVGA